MKKALAILGLGAIALASLLAWPRLVRPPQPSDGRTLDAASLIPVEPPSDYAWVDRNQGVARIPITRAMDIVGEKGLSWGKVKEEPAPAQTEAVPVPTEKKTNAPWLDPAMIQIGQALFTMYRCASCHVAGSSFPPLNGKYGARVNLEGGDTALFDDAYIIESMIAPNAKIAAGYKPQMPPYNDRISEEEIKQIVIYIRSLK